MRWHAGAAGVAVSTLSYYYHIYPADVRQRKVVTGVLLVTVLGLISVTATAALEGGLTLRAIQGSVNGMEMLVSISLMHQVYADKHREPMYRTTVFRLAGCFAVLAAGTAIWGLGFPEAFAPRTFDIFGASHQIFHISVISALVLYQYTVVKFWEHLAREAYDYSMGARAHPSSRRHDQLEAVCNPIAIARSSELASAKLSAYGGAWPSTSTVAVKHHKRLELSQGDRDVSSHSFSLQRE